MKGQKEQPQRVGNPYAKESYGVLNHPYKLFGIMDWRYLAAAVPFGVFAGLLGHSKIVGIIVALLLAWRFYEISESDPLLPLVWMKTFWEKEHLCPFKEKN